MSILEQINKAYTNKQPFVCYRKPNELNTSLYIQKDDSIYYAKDLKERGFVFAPFDNSNASILIPIDSADFFEEQPIISNKLSFNKDFAHDVSSKEAHIKLVDSGIKAIQDNLFKKVVLSRKEEVLLENFDLTTTFQKLLYLYPTAMVYVWFHPKVGLWLGATPETLVKINNNQFKTMSLAGTQLFQKDIKVTWNQKEIDEQQFVTDYILDKLSAITEQISTSNVNTIKAGNLVHLQTTIEGTHRKNIAEIIDALHPTPAVCGLPKEVSKQFILDNENYQRTYYTGYLGELNIDNHSNLFVNLRCMEITQAIAHIYIGGGITVDSNPEKEWLETVAKTSTMKKAL